MDDKIIFTQRSHKKSMLILITYCVLLIRIAIFIGIGTFGILDFISSFQRGILPGILAGIIFLSPLVFLVRLTKTKIMVEFSSNNIRIIKKKAIDIPVNLIEKMIVNEPRANTLNLYSSKKLLFCFDAGNGSSSLNELTNRIKNLGNFKLIKRKRKMMNGEIDVMEYNKK